MTIKMSPPLIRMAIYSSLCQSWRDQSFQIQNIRVLSLSRINLEESYNEKTKIAGTNDIKFKLVLLWAQLTKIYPPLPKSVQPISITKTLLIVPTKNERDPPLFIGKLLIQFQNILRNTTVLKLSYDIG
jgi:hypothetical protein